MEAVLIPACHYAERVHRDKTVSIGLSWVHILYLKQQLSRPDAYKVVDFSLQRDCKKTFEKLVKKRVLPQNLLPEAHCWRGVEAKPRERNTSLCRHHNLPQLKLPKQ